MVLRMTVEYDPRFAFGMQLFQNVSVKNSYGFTKANVTCILKCCLDGTSE